MKLMPLLAIVIAVVYDFLAKLLLQFKGKFVMIFNGRALPLLREHVSCGKVSAINCLIRELLRLSTNIKFAE